MKLSIWQQFSSNHSNAFTIVGQFANEAKAQEAAKRLGEILDRMLTNAEQVNGNELIKQQIENLGEIWQHKTLPDWLSIAPIEIKPYDNMLFVEVYNNWSIHQPLDLLFDKLGSQSTASDSELDGDNIRWTCEFDIVDMSQADALEVLVLDVLTVDIKDYYEKYADFPVNMMYIMWRDDISDSPVILTRKQTHFWIVNARFYHGIRLADAVSNFSMWLEECGASNIQYSVTNKSS